jgi:hypothetical protein
MPGSKFGGHHFRMKSVAPIEFTLSEREYDFRVIGAGEEVSTNRWNPVIELVLQIKSIGSTALFYVFDSLVFVPYLYWRIDSFRLCTGDIVKPGETVIIEAEDWLGRMGRCTLYVHSHNSKGRIEVFKYLAPEKKSVRIASW